MNHPEIAIPEKEQVSQAAGTVGFFTFLSRILGLVRDIVVARFFGAGLVTDAFFVAFRIPNLLRRLFAEGSLTIAFIPVFTEYLSQKTKEDAFQLARVVLTLLSVVLAVVTLLGILLSPWIVRIQAFGFGGSGIKYDLTVLLTRITFPYIFLISLVAFFMGILNSLRHFAAPAAAPIFLNIGIIASTLWISPHFSEPVIGVAIGVLIGGVLQVALQIPWVLRKGLSLLPRWMPDHPAVKRIGLLMLPAIFGSAIYQFNQFVGTLLASFLAEGSVSWLYYADRLVQFPLGVFAIAISTAALPSLSRKAAEKELDEFRDTLGHALRLVFFITIPSMVGLIILGKLIIQVFFERGAFDAFSTAMTTHALVFYSLGLWAFSGIRVMVSAFYAFQDTKTPVKVAAVAMVANLVFSLLFIALMEHGKQHGGLALALSLASALQFGLLIFFLKRRFHEWDLRPILVSAWKIILASIVMGLGIYYTYSHWWVPKPELGIWHLATHLAGLVFIGVFIYFAVTRILGCDELSSVLDMFKPLLRRTRSGR
ncbi:MAG: murein biosynthesis integral membrane protein MurJ [Deltaproteobacteria bacterium]|nr:MAG: murein biosynthesis integral membrane protein MurJ [Deltaproteobacteria bacterium]